VLLIHNQLALTMIGNPLLRGLPLFACASPGVFEVCGTRNAIIDFVKQARKSAEDVWMQAFVS
jgi:hypothetical protein